MKNHKIGFGKYVYTKSETGYIFAVFRYVFDVCCVSVYGAKTHMDGLFQQRTCRGERNVTRLEGTQLSALNTSETSPSNKKTY